MVTVEANENLTETKVDVKQRDICSDKYFVTFSGFHFFFRHRQLREVKKQSRKVCPESIHCTTWGRNPSNIKHFSYLHNFGICFSCYRFQLSLKFSWVRVYTVKFVQERLNVKKKSIDFIPSDTHSSSRWLRQCHVTIPGNFAFSLVATPLSFPSIYHRRTITTESN